MHIRIARDVYVVCTQYPVHNMQISHGVFQVTAVTLSVNRYLSVT